MKPFWDAYPEVARDLEDVRAAILSHVSTDNAEVQSAIRHLLSASGKMLRPGFALLSSRFGDARDRGRVIRAAAALEMLHMATLVHDDIIDGSPMRRGVATLNALRGPRTAVLVGDWLLASSLSLVADNTAQQDARSLARLVTRICGSEISQSTDRFVVHTSVRRYMRRIAGKTAALFALSFHVGATEGGCDGEARDVLRRLGYCIGMGFQITDDILDFSTSGAETGKPSLSDLSQGVFTLPVIVALRRDVNGLEPALSRGRMSRRAVQRAARFIQDRGGIDGARRAAETYTRRALREIGRLPPLPVRETLRDVTEKLLVRTY
jgi:heptaprenyl diphosphate synthase